MTEGSILEVGETIVGIRHDTPMIRPAGRAPKKCSCPCRQVRGREGMVVSINEDDEPPTALTRFTWTDHDGDHDHCVTYTLGEVATYEIPLLEFLEIGQSPGLAGAFSLVVDPKVEAFPRLLEMVTEEDYTRLHDRGLIVPTQHGDLTWSLTKRGERAWAELVDALTEAD